MCLAARSASIGLQRVRGTSGTVGGIEVLFAGMSDVPVGLSASRFRQLPKSKATKSQVDRQGTINI